MHKYVIVAVVSSLILFTMGGVHTQDQIKAHSLDAHKENAATTGLSRLVTSNSDSWTTGGPYGGYINSLAMAPSNPDIIYAGTESGMFKTADGGDTWTEAGLAGTLVRVVQVAADNPDIVYAGTDDGVYKSEDGGSTWTQKGLSGARVNAIAIDPGNPLTLYAGTGWPNRIISGEIVGIFKTSNGGTIWQEKYSEPAEDAIMALLVDADDSLYIYAGTNGGYGSPLGRSTDGGDTWFGKPIGADNIVALAMTPAGSDPAAIYAVGGGDDVYKSTDRGDSWTPTNTPYISYASPWALAVDPNDPNIVYVGTHYYQGRFYKSPDGGDNWSIKADGLPPSCPSSIVIDPRDSDVYAGLSEGGVYKSADGAENWSLSSQGMNNTYINHLALHPTSSDTAFAAVKGRGHYLAKTTNGGTSWEYLSDSPTDRGAVAFDPQNPSTIYAGFGWRGRSNQVYSIDKSTDGGQSWTSAGILFSTFEYNYLGVSDIWVNPSYSSTILVAVAGWGTDGGGVYKSTDGGATWPRTYSFWATTLAADPSSPEVLYFGSQQCGYVFRSTDGGSNWTNISPSAPPEECWVWEVRDIEVALNSHVYAATDEGLMKWDGSSWNKLTGLPTDDITALAIDRSTNPGIVYLGTANAGVFVSEDGGGTWTPINQGLGSLSITKLAISASQPKMLYAGTAYGSVWQCTLAPSGYEIYLPLTLKNYPP